MAQVVESCLFVAFPSVLRFIFLWLELNGMVQLAGEQSIVFKFREVIDKAHKKYSFVSIFFFTFTLVPLAQINEMDVFAR